MSISFIKNPLNSYSSFDEEPLVEEFRDSEYKDSGPMTQNVRQDFGIENITDSKSPLFDFLFSGKKEIKKLCGLFGTVNKTFQRNPTITKDDLKKTFQHYYGVNLEDNGTGYGLFNLVERIRKANIDTEMLNIKRDIKRLGVNYYIDNNTRHERKLLEDEDYEQYGEPIGELFKMLIKNIEDKDTFNFEGSWRLLKRSRTARYSGDADVKNEDVFGILFVYDKYGASVEGRGIVFHIYRNTYTNLGAEVKMKKVQSYFMVENNTLTIYEKGLQPEIVKAIETLTGIELKNINKEANLPNNSSNVNNKSNIPTVYEEVPGKILEDGNYGTVPGKILEGVNYDAVPGKILVDRKYVPQPPVYDLPSSSESNNKNTYDTTTDRYNLQFEKYDKMKKRGVPEGAVRQKMIVDGISEEEIDKYLGSESEKIDENWRGRKTVAKQKKSSKAGIDMDELRKRVKDPRLKSVNKRKEEEDSSLLKGFSPLKNELLAAAAARQAAAREKRAEEIRNFPSPSPETVATRFSEEEMEDTETEEERYDREANSEIPAVTISDEELNRLNSEMKYFNFRRSLDKKTILLEELKEPKNQGNPLDNSKLGIGPKTKRFLNNIDTSFGGRKTRRRSSNKRRKSKKVGGKKTKPKRKTKGKKIPFKKLLKKTRAKKH